MTFKCVYCSGEVAESREVRDAKDGKPIVVAACSTCGLGQLQRVPSLEELRDFYTRSYRVAYKGLRKPRLKHVFRAGNRAKERLRKMTPYVRSGDVHLDIGSGGGEFVYLAKSAGLNAHGIDLAEDYLNFAKTTYDVDVLHMGIQDLSETGTYDVVTMFHVLEHLSDPEAAFAKVHSVLKDNGVFVVEVPNLESRETAPTNAFFKAHIMYFTRPTLEMIASKYFDVEFIESTRHIFAVLRKRPISDENSELRADSVAVTQDRVRNKTISEYAANGGLSSALRKVVPTVHEKLSIAGKDHKSILDRLNVPSF